ncbi:hypothetical protein A8F21_19120 [Burkholderia cenocepacia]|nr:hypothetical protein A8F21_19120 [Burkholderia cenocepacia]
MARVTVRASGRPARQPCVLYSVTGSNTQARGKLHGLVWLPPDFTVLVSTEHTRRRAFIRAGNISVSNAATQARRRRVCEANFSPSNPVETDTSPPPHRNQ